MEFIAQNPSPLPYAVKLGEFTPEHRNTLRYARNAARDTYTAVGRKNAFPVFTPQLCGKSDRRSEWGVGGWEGRAGPETESALS